LIPQNCKKLVERERERERIEEKTNESITALTFHLSIAIAGESGSRMQHYISIAYRKALSGGFCFVEFGPVLRIFGLNPFVGTYPLGPVFLCLPVFEAGSFLDVETAQAAAAEEEDWLLKNQILLFIFVLKVLLVRLSLDPSICFCESAAVSAHSCSHLFFLDSQNVSNFSGVFFLPMLFCVVLQLQNFRFHVPTASLCNLYVK
jgi:hypothetical protein